MIQTEEAVGESIGFPKSVPLKRLVNILNYANFKEDGVLINLKSLQNGSRLTLKAAPQPCRGNMARFSWSESPPSNIGTAYDLVDFFVDIGLKLLIVEGRLTDIGPSGMTVLLPERCYAISRRRIERYRSVFAHVTLSRNRAKVTGLLRDFGGGFLKVRFTAPDLDLLHIASSKQLLHIALTRGDSTVFTGKGLVKRRLASGDSIDLVLELMCFIEGKPEVSQEVPFEPALVATYRHPLSDKIVRVHLTRASYNSLVVREHPEHVTLFQGLIIPEMSIDFGTGDSAQCVAKVMFGDGDTWFMSILDMPILDQRKLFSFVERERGMVSTVCTKIDPDDLLEFFFEAGFIYPEKYASMAHSRDQLKAVLSRLYIDAPSISQHFVHENKGAIDGHISMVRFHERSWIIHHHAALGNGAGSTVLTRIFRYINSYSALPSTHMDYLMCYYRHENRFPNRVLGGFARFLSTPSLCSVDPFAYLHLDFNKVSDEIPGSENWQLEPASRKDLRELEAFYMGTSGGLALKAFGIDAPHGRPQRDDLDLEFAKAGLRRRKLLFSLRLEGKLKAVMIALDSDDGLNMSNFMKCIHIFVIDAENLPFDLLTGQLNSLSSLYEEQNIPILLYPQSYVTDQGVSPEKTYDLLVVHASACKQFADFTERLTDRAARRARGTLTSDLEGQAIE